MSTDDDDRWPTDDEILAEYAEEEAEAAEMEIAERNATLDVPLNLRIDHLLDEQLRRAAAADQIPVSALVRRLLREGLLGRFDHRTLTVAQVEEIVRRVMSETA